MFVFYTDGLCVCSCVNYITYNVHVHVCTPRGRQQRANGLSVSLTVYCCWNQWLHLLWSWGGRSTCPESRAGRRCLPQHREPQTLVPVCCEEEALRGLRAEIAADSLAASAPVSAPPEKTQHYKQPSNVTSHVLVMAMNTLIHTHLPVWLPVTHTSPATAHPAGVPDVLWQVLQPLQYAQNLFVILESRLAQQQSLARHHNTLWEGANKN